MRQAHRALCASFWFVACVGAPAAHARDLHDVFVSRATPRVSAVELLERAEALAWPPTGRMRIDIVRESASGREEREAFVVLRRRTSEGLRIVTENLAPDRSRTGRVLQIEPAAGETIAYAFVKAAGPEPVETRYRLADPYLCTWYDPEVNGAEADRVASSAEREILARRAGRVAGEDVQWLQVKPAALRRFHHSELAIADRDAAILEYRHFLRRGDREPSLVVRVPREAMVATEGGTLPGVLRYEDRVSRERIRIEIAHSALPPDLPDSAFEPGSFHRIRIE